VETVRDAEQRLRKEGFSRKSAKTAVAAMKKTGYFEKPKKQNFFTRLYNAVKGE